MAALETGDRIVLGKPMSFRARLTSKLSFWNTLTELAGLFNYPRARLFICKERATEIQIVKIIDQVK